MTAPPPLAPAAFVDLAAVSFGLAATRSRLTKTRLLVEALAKVPGDEIAAAVGWLVAAPLSGPIGVGPAQLWALSQTEAPADATVTLREVEVALAAAAAEPRAEAYARVAALFAKLTSLERGLFVGALTGSLRQGSVEGVMLLAVAELASALGHDEAAVRRAAMVTGSLARAADALLGAGRGQAPPAALELLRPIAPMLASPAASLEEAFEGAVGDRLVEWKVDGVRAQVHKSGARVAVFSRQGNDMTAGCAPLVASLSALPVEAAVLDGEVVLVGGDGVARPFQDTFSAVASGGALPPGDALRAYFFDCMHADGRDLLDQPLSARRAALEALVPAELIMPSIVAATVDAARAFERAALAAGHEGVMVKELASPYRSGARGRPWQKIKEHATVDLVVLAVEHGSGRRQGLLSNLHLGARRDDGTFCMVGKTFKGLTDELLRWQTARLRELALEEKGHVVHVRPELVVEIRYSDVQRSPRYPGGVALRFARVVRYRPDKPASEADTLASLVARLPGPARVGPAGRTGKSKRRKKSDRQLSLFGD